LSVSATSRVATERGERYRKQLASHFGNKIEVVEGPGGTVLTWGFGGSTTLTVEDGTTYLLNPGSIGQPRDGDTRAAFVIADLQQKSIEFWRVPYDIEAVQKRMGAGGLPEPLIQRLAFGR